MLKIFDGFTSYSLGLRDMFGQVDLYPYSVGIKK